MRCKIGKSWPLIPEIHTATWSFLKFDMRRHIGFTDMRQGLKIRVGPNIIRHVTLGKISDNDMRHCHLLKSTCDTGGDPIKSPKIVRGGSRVTATPPPPPEKQKIIVHSLIFAPFSPLGLSPHGSVPVFCPLHILHNPAHSWCVTPLSN